MDPQLPGRFWTKVNRNGPTQDHMDTRCWEWAAGKDRDGYGRFRWGDKNMAAHRVAFLLATGQEPEIVCHKCNNRSCVRPNHLYAGDSDTNLIDTLVDKFRKLKDNG